jgi:hypothetical protein
MVISPYHSISKKDAPMLPGSVKGFIAVMAGVLKFWQKSQKADSLIKYTQTTRVEPIVIIDKRALYLSYLPDVLQSLNSVFAGYYLQAAAISCTVGKIQVGQLLNHLNPERPFLESRNAAMECFVGTKLQPADDYRLGLPNASRPALESIKPTLSHAMEDFDKAQFSADVDKSKAAITEGAQAFMKGMDVTDHVIDASSGLKGIMHTGKTGQKQASATSQGHSADIGKDMREVANLAVGRVYTVELSDGGHTAQIPVTIRLLTTECDPELLVHILSDGARVVNSSAKERWFGFKLRDLAFWRDLVMCQDLIDEHKAALLKDNNGVYAAMLKRRRGNMASAVVSRQPSVGTASNLVVMTRDTVRQLEAVIGGKLESVDIRNKIFEASYLMIVVVIDPDFDHVTIYHRGIDLATELSVRDLKSAAKGSGPDVAEILKAYQLGNAPSF